MFINSSLDTDTVARLVVCGAWVEGLAVEVETLGGPGPLFRLRIDASVIAKGLSAGRPDVFVGEILDRIAARGRAGPTS
jgi:hypothetical protein